MSKIHSIEEVRLTRDGIEIIGCCDVVVAAEERGETSRHRRVLPLSLMDIDGRRWTS